MNFKMVRYILGWIFIFEAMFMAVPLLTALIYGETALWFFLGSAALCLIIRRLLTFKARKHKAVCP